MVINVEIILQEHIILWEKILSKIYKMNYEN